MLRLALRSCTWRVGAGACATAAATSPPPPATTNGSACASPAMMVGAGAVRHALWTSRRCLSASAWRHMPQVPTTGLGGGDDDAFAFEFDPMAGVRHDAAVETAKKSVHAIVEELAPPNASAAALAKIHTYLQQHPIDSLILHAEVQITHIENPETGVDDRVHLSPMDIKDALEQAQLRKMNLVQMGARGDDLAYCRIRRERPWVWKLVQPEMDLVAGLTGVPSTAGTAAAATAAGTGDTSAVTPQQQDGAGADKPRQYMGKTKELIDHAFRDAVDAHFVGWRSKKIVQDIRKGHPVKITIRDFQSAEAAIHKLHEMSNAIKANAEELHVYHHFTSIVANDREASLTLSPPTANKSGTISKQVKHPSDKDWGHALQRMDDACAKSGRSGTYVKSNKLKRRSVGLTSFRVDKYGRRID